MATILLVDEHSHSRGFIAWLLQSRGHRVWVASRGDEALSRLDSEPVDLAVIDLLSPDQGGHGLLKQMREAGHLPTVVFRVPACAEAEARALAHACGVEQVVAADAPPSRLIAAVDAALASPCLPLMVTDDEALCARLFSIVKAQERRIDALETVNVQLEQQAVESAMQRDAAREALGSEVAKRLRGEREMARRHRALQAQAVRDPLTGLYNRRYLEESLEREEGRARRSGRSLGLMVMDIDHFKRWNDSYGHAAGDAVLRGVAHVMETLARSEDILCRYGGEEFVLAMANTSQEALRQRAEDLRAGVERLRIEHDGRILGPVTLSIGVALFPEAGASAGEVLKAADAALYQAKAAGRNRVATAA